MLCDDLEGWVGGKLKRTGIYAHTEGGKLKREGRYAHTEPTRVVAPQKLTHIVKHYAPIKSKLIKYCLRNRACIFYYLLSSVAAVAVWEMGVPFMRE